MSIGERELRPGYRISEIIKGGWQLAGGHGSVDREKAISAIPEFVEAGITTFDCADIYTGVEALIGESLARYKLTDKVRVHTKLVPDLDRLPSCTAKDLEAIVDRSLSRLKIERLDLVQFFWWDLAIGRPVETLASLSVLQDKGKIRHLGINNWDVAAIAPFVAAGVEVVSAQVQYSLLDDRPTHGLSDWCETNNVGLLCYGVLAGGFLTEAWLGQSDPGYSFTNRSLVKYRLIIDEFGGWDSFQSLLQTCRRIADRHGVSLSAVAARYVLDRPQVSAIIIGARYAAHLDETLAIGALRLDESDVDMLRCALSNRAGPRGPVYGLESDRESRHGAIMKYNLGSGD